MSPKLRSLLARVVLIGGTASVGTYVAKSAPHDQSVAVRLGGRDLTRIQGVVIKAGDAEPTAGFSQNFPEGSPPPHLVRHGFSAPDGTYIVVINWTERRARDENEQRDPAATRAAPKLIETSFERRVSLVGGEVIVSPD